MQFYEFFMTISINSVECERIFSAMNFIKDKKKANLTVRKLYQRPLIYIHGPENLKDFDLMPMKFFATSWKKIFDILHCLTI